MIVARYVWDTRILEAGFRIHYKTQRWAKILPVAGMVCIAIGVYQCVASAHSSHIEGAPFLCFGAILLAVPAIALRQFRRSVRRSPTYGYEMTYTFSPQQIVISGKGFHSTLTWEKLYSATVSRDGVLLYPQKAIFHWIPTSAFGSAGDIDTVRSFLEQNRVRTRNA